MKSNRESLLHILDAMNSAIIGQQTLEGDLIANGEIGNIVIRCFGATEVRLLSRPGIVGGNRRTPSEEHMNLSPGNVIVLYTDGIRDRFGLDDYPALLHDSAESIAATVVRRFGKDYDDASCVALRFDD